MVKGIPRLATLARNDNKDGVKKREKRILFRLLVLDCQREGFLDSLALARNDNKGEGIPPRLSLPRVKSRGSE